MRFAWLLLVSAIASAAPPIEPGTEVVAVVDEIQRNAIEERIQGGPGIITWTLVKMTILSPEGDGNYFTAFCAGPPFIGTDHMWVGQRVTFRMPPKEWGRPVPLDHLEGLQPYILEGSIPLGAAKRVFEEARVASADDGGKLWGRTLYGPMIVVDPKTRFFVRNDLFIDTLPANVIIANTATNIDSVMTTMIPWTSLQERTSTQRRRLLMHESWHRIQKDIGFPAAEGDNAHLDTVDGRYWLRLELRALAAALRATGDARNAAIGDAVAFRAARRAQFAKAAESERALENNEGLAEYTGWALRGTTAEESRLTFARHLDNIDPATSFVRGFAYETGPAYGLLLDALAPGWTRKYKVADDLSAVLNKAAGGLKPAAPRVDAYGGAELRAAEETRDRKQRERVARFRARLVDGPVLELPMTDANYGFDPNGVTALGAAGNAYEHLDVTAAWGKISVDGGARITGDWTKIIVAAADRAKLELKPGWKVVAGPREGDLRVVHE
ncbi:MAG: hypothetical protein AABO58_23825 [Acidobacteriota bacterium]